ncbi:two-component regulator propeller domain-containing protein [Paraflavisolibacter sp. H34]|uniref:hybrid sensor histidine kinase/response regulator transcription factor n=1 Tax=Huijunlia imazamoxiresistens TaxID=3127457 RepID=UPI0030193C6A
MFLKRFLTICFCLLQLALRTGAQPLNFTALRPKDGLSSNTINDIRKDRLGLMWFATEDGLNKFDGTNFTVYRHRPGDPSSIPSNEILALHEDRAGNLWVGANSRSLALYDRKKDAFTRYPLDMETNGDNGVIRSVFRDHEGKVWVAHWGGLTILDSATGKLSPVRVAPGRPGANRNITCVFEDSRHRMWVGSEEGLYLYRPQTRSCEQVLAPGGETPAARRNSVLALAEDQKGNLWVGTRDGIRLLRAGARTFIDYTPADGAPNALSSNHIYALATEGNRIWLGTEEGLNILDTQTGAVTRYAPDLRNIHSLTDKSIRSVYIDNGGIYWLGTFQGGVNKYDRNLNLFHLKQANVFDEKGLNAPVVTSFAEDKAGNVFVGTDGGGLSLFNRQTEVFRQFPLQPQGKAGRDRLSILTLEMSRKGLLYIGTFGNGLFILDPATGAYRQLKRGPRPEDLSSNDLFSIREDRHGNIWVGTNGEGVHVFNADNQLVLKYVSHPSGPNERQLPGSDYIRAIVEDRDGRIWLGTHGGGITVLDPATGRFTIYNKSTRQLAADAVLSLLEDRQGNIWAGTLNGGLSRWDRKTNRFATFSEKEGLPGTIVYALAEDRRGQIWASTNKGICSFDAQAKLFSNYTYHNGVQHNNFVRGAGLRASDGTLFFGGLEGFNYFDPGQQKENKNVSSILLTELRVDHKPVAPSEKGPLAAHISVAREIHLDYKQNFSLGFVALNYTTPEQNRYAYKLEGFDKGWNNVGTATTASYTNLDPGTYVFHVRAGNDGTWNSAETSIKIFVHPPFWRTIPAYIFYVLALAGLVAYLRHKGIQRLKRKFALEQERLQARQRLEQERREAERVRELDRLKIKFLTNLSHEFRTPISLIMGPVDQLLTGEKNERASGQLQMIKRNARRLLNLVSQLLDFRKMEEHELKLQPSEGELVAFTREVSDSFRDLSERKKVSFTFESSIDRLYTAFDRDKLERILFNLLSNAFKFTLAGGSIRLELEPLPQPSGADWVSLKVCDTGIGIPADKQALIFERFFQSDTTAAVLNQGTGIGLAITREFVHLHGGTIAVASEPGQGTTFTIHLPFTPLPEPATSAEAPAAEAEAPLLPASEPEPVPEETVEPETVSEPAEAPAAAAPVLSNLPSILLVEDNEDFRFYLKDNLKAFYKVYEAANGKEGWQKALAHHPQLIVTDIHMPLMDGIELCRKIKGDKRTGHIPVVLLTALTGEEAQIKGLETGANDYITKPFNFEVLNAKINNLLVLNRTLKDTYTKQIKVLTPEVEIESDDAKFLNRVMVYLEENLTNSQLSVEDLSRQMGMSRVSLYHKLRELTGQTPVEYIRSVKLEKAAVLLEKSDMNIAQVAYSVGFATPNYFAKSFKAKYDMLPSEYMNRMRKGAEGKKADS